MALQDELQTEKLARDREGDTSLGLMTQISAVRHQMAGETNASRLAGYQSELDELMARYNALQAQEAEHG